MSTPRTLLQMAGAPTEPTRLSDSTIVIIDAQNEYVDGRLPLAGVDTALDAIARLLAEARAASAPVIHIVHRGRAGGLFDPTGPMFKIHPKAAAIDGEAIIEKELPNAFAKTGLQLALIEHDRPGLVIAGFMTHLCVSATARAALDHGLRTTVVADAAATRDLPDPLGGSALPAETVHRAALAEIADRFAVVTRVADLRS